MDYITDYGEGLRELALFAGAGGGILGGILCGFRTICAVEIDPYCRAVLCQRQNEGVLPPFPVWDDVRTFDGREWRGLVDIISGGFPCTDISTANPKGQGLDGENSGLWSEMRRIIGEVRPQFVLVENSPNIINKGGCKVVGDLAALGYDCRWGIVSAADAGAPHLRKRWWCLAYANGVRQQQPQGRERNVGGRVGDGGQAMADSGGDGLHGQKIAGGFQQEKPEPKLCCTSTTYADGELGSARRPESARQNGASGLADGGGDLADTTDTGDVRRERRAGGAEESDGGCGGSPEDGRGEWWATEPAVGRVAHGVANRVHRLKAIGNGQVPAVLKLFWGIITGGELG
jgi:DNA (cytosine-5)-methyltransferase 1